MIGMLARQAVQSGSLRRTVSEGLAIEWHRKLVERLRPRVIVETGVHRGRSTAAWLWALHRIGLGRLVSIDLPFTEPRINADGQPDDAHVTSLRQIGDRVPDRLKTRWTLLLGDARELLPLWLPRLAPIDLFYHDSDHTYAHMLYEYRVAWPHLRDGGVLASDDVDRNTAFSEFAHEVGRTATFDPYLNRGVIYK